MKGVEYFSRSDNSNFCDYCDGTSEEGQAKAVIVRKYIINLGTQGMEVETVFLCRDHARKHFPQSIRLLRERSPEIQQRVFPLFNWLICPLCKSEFSDNSARTEHMLREHSEFFEKLVSSHGLTCDDNGGEN